MSGIIWGTIFGNNNIYLYTENTMTLLKIISFFGSIIHQTNFAQNFEINLGQFWEKFWEQFWEQFREQFWEQCWGQSVEKFGG